MLHQTDLLFKTQRIGNRTTVRVTHIPTNVSIQTEGEGYLRIREEAIKLLELELANRRLS